MKQVFDVIVIGTGQSGPSFASRCVQEGKKVAIIERKKFGGSCVNYGCTPTKTLVADAKVAYTIRTAERFGIHVPSFSVDMKKIKARKAEIVHQSSSGLESWLRSLENMQVFQGHARFISPTEVQVGKEILEGKQIFINVGGRSATPPIKNLDKVPYLTNVSILELEELPKHLVIVGGGYISLEFAQIFSRLGSQVTIVHRSEQLMKKEDADVSTAIKEILEKESVEIFLNAKNFEVMPDSHEYNIHGAFDLSDGRKEILGSHLLIATGRRPNTDDLGLEKAQVQTDSRGFIEVNDQLLTSQSHIWALGDCNGRGAFTHTSYNDYEILAANLFERANRKISDRIPIYNLYIDPPLGRIGMTEKEARSSNKQVLMATMPMSGIARAREKGETEGFLKILVDENTKEILGASFLGTGCDEVIQMIAMVMYAKAPYTLFQESVLIHPTVSELIPTLLSRLQPIEHLATTKS